MKGSLLKIVGSVLFLGTLSAGYNYNTFYLLSVPANAPMPDSHQTGDTFMGGTWRGLTMTDIKGNQADSILDSLVPLQTYYYRGASFVSPPLIAQTIPAGIWTIKVFVREDNPSANAYVRYMVYEWLNTDELGNIIVPVSSANMEMPTTKSLQTIYASGNAVTISDGSRICIDLEIEGRGPGNPNRYAMLYFGNNSDTSSLKTPQSIIGMDESRKSSPAEQRHPTFHIYPNPLKDRLVIEYYVVDENPVSLAVYESSGYLVKRLSGYTSERKGVHKIIWDCRDNQGNRVKSGVYFLHLTIGEHSIMKKTVVVQ
ncbi:MAG: T9SS type A sorting domain-containing protein [candidate division WOR-3 bacterium]